VKLLRSFWLRYLLSEHYILRSDNLVLLLIIPLLAGMVAYLVFGALAILAFVAASI
jgi:hypothetical protein